MVVYSLKKPIFFIGVITATFLQSSSVLWICTSRKSTFVLAGKKINSIDLYRSLFYYYYLTNNTNSLVSFSIFLPLF